jgi:ABC-type nitrate/sulfonate/bicarbonate transport system substrate-binding protein
MIHEWLHVAGFVHQGKKGDAPYVVGAIVRAILKGEAFLEAHEEPEAAEALDEAFDDVGEDALP